MLESLSRYTGLLISLTILIGGGYSAYLVVRGNKIKYLKDKIEELEKENKTLREANLSLTKQIEELMTGMKDHNDRIVTLETQNAYLQELVTGRGTLEKVAKVVDLIHADTIAVRALVSSPNPVETKVISDVKVN